MSYNNRRGNSRGGFARNNRSDNNPTGQNQNQGAASWNSFSRDYNQSYNQNSQPRNTQPAPYQNFNGNTRNTRNNRNYNTNEGNQRYNRPNNQNNPIHENRNQLHSRNETNLSSFSDSNFSSLSTQSPQNSKTQSKNTQKSNHQYTQRESEKFVGKVVTVKDQFGFIKPNNDSIEIYFRFSDVLENEELQELDEVEFEIFKNAGNRKKKPVARNVKLISRVTLPSFGVTKKIDPPPPAIEKPKIGDLPLFTPQWMQSGSSFGNASTKSTLTSSNKPPTSSFDMLSLTPSTTLGGSVTHSKKSNLQKVSNREKGIVQNVKDTFGFIKSNSRKELIFYHVNEIENRQLQSLHEGDEVEFTLVVDPEKDLKEAVSIRFVKSVSGFGTDLIERDSEDSYDFFLDTNKLINMNLGLSGENLSQSNDIEENLNQNQNQFSDKQSIKKWLTKISKNSEVLILEIEKLNEILNKDDLNFVIMDQVLDIITQNSITSSERTDKIFSVVQESKFITNPRNLKAYIRKLCNIAKPNKKQINSFQNIVELQEQFVERFNSYPILTLLHNQKVQFSFPDSYKSIEALSKHRTKAKSYSSQQQISNWNSEEDKTETNISDFHDLPIYPSFEEIFTIKKGKLSSHLRKNIVKGKYENTMHYLDTHFRLLREDCIQPLRAGIQNFIHTDEKSRDIRFYYNVQPKGIQCSRTGILYRISFQVDQSIAWERSKRLIYGSLVCLSCDNFETLLWATVANRDTNLLKSEKCIDIRFPNGYELNFKKGSNYIMVESATTYFEAYKHVLSVMQEIDIDNFPFESYLVHCETDVKPPSYLKDTDRYNMANIFDGGKVNFPILQEKWPINDINTTLDDTQFAALKNALTKEFSIIQGPPGTGKTFVGLKIMKAWLDNSKFRKPAPILVVCFTNHALDQFLEGCFDFEENIVRIGSRSKSEKLKDKNLRQLVYDAFSPGEQNFKSRKTLAHQLEKLQKQIELIITELNRNELTRDNIEKYANSYQLESLYQGSSSVIQNNNYNDSKFNSKYFINDPNKKKSSYLKVGDEDGLLTLKFWLEKDASTVISENYIDSNKKTYDLPTEIYTDISSYFDDSDDEEEIDDEIIQRMQLDRMVGDEENQQNNVLELEIDEIAEETLPYHISQCKDVWDLEINERHMLYRSWVREHRQYYGDSLVEICERYEKFCTEKEALENDVKVEVLSRAKVIGITTTGVAKFKDLIQECQPEILMIEEAAEVLEAHILTSFSSATKHVVLIGDHQQLRPATAVYELAINYNLDVSMFERLVNNGIEHVTLSKQRRMRPVISNLIKFLYPNLSNHQSVSEYPKIMGVNSNLFFLDHQFLEDIDSETGSKSNKHEATFLAKLCNYLLLQGYTPSQITVLTAYSGQARLLSQEFKKMGIYNVHITTVDNFQGEENDIILLSLVRSNKEGIIGFLNTSNRVCVALSRARHGMFIIGNSSLLIKKNEFWRNVIEKLKQDNSFGSALTLCCQNHPSKKTEVSCAASFKNVEDGGCDKPCQQILNCSHPCPRMCHPYSHDIVNCYRPCERIHSDCGHGCPKKCFEDCGDCEVKVEKRMIDCSHIQSMPCHLDPSEFVCTEPCERKLDCGHDCPKSCGEKCATFCHVIVTRLHEKCQHPIQMECSDNIFRQKCTFIGCENSKKPL